MTAELLWIGIGATLVAAVAVFAIVRAWSARDELGSVSMRWVAHHLDM